MLKIAKYFALVFSLMFFCSSLFVSAMPEINILSPQNGNVYNSTKILLNVSSSERVDFYVGSPRTKNVIKLDSTFYNSFLFGKEGNYTYTIYANNSNGTTNATVEFSISVHNPINITDCGQLVSSDAAYRLVNNLSGNCLQWADNVNNISLNLNGFKVESTSFAPISASCYFSEIYNGTLVQTVENTLAGIDIQSADSCSFRDLIIESPTIGIYSIGGERISIMNSKIVAPYGLFMDGGSTRIDLINVSLVGSKTSLGESAIYHQFSSFDMLTLNNVTFANYTKQVNLDNNFQVEYILRNTYIDISNITPSYGFARFVTQHLAIINLTDNQNNPIDGVIEIIDQNENNNISNTVEKIDSNPTSHVFAGTDEHGVARVFLTEKIDIRRTFSPTQSDAVRFDPYILTGRSKGVSNDIVLDFSTVNSTVYKNISLAFDGGLPKCSISQMLDLNNDGSVDSDDVYIIVKYKTGSPVSENSTKGCEGINLNPF